MQAARLLVLLVAILTATTVGLTATNTVPVSSAGSTTAAVTANTLKPAACVLLTLAGVYPGAGTFTAPNAIAWLVLGSAATDTISGGNKGDCIVGGAGNDAIDGRGGTDVCIGGPGTDTFANCESTYS